jgi:hypothetical protein
MMVNITTLWPLISASYSVKAMTFSSQWMENFVNDNFLVSHIQGQIQIPLQFF